MLIIAIPKSASTALMQTLSKLHNMDGRQIFFPEREVPKGVKCLNKRHGDVREINDEIVKGFSDEKTIYKQHIFPTKNNTEKLSGIKKVILLRDPEEIVGAYERFGKENINKSDELLSELKTFHDGWSQKSKNILIIQYKELISDTKNAINRIETFWRLPKTEGEVRLERVRYSRGNKCKRILENFVRGCKNRVAKVLIKLGAYECVRRIYRKVMRKPGY